MVSIGLVLHKPREIFQAQNIGERSFSTDFPFMVCVRVLVCSAHQYIIHKNFNQLTNSHHFRVFSIDELIIIITHMNIKSYEIQAYEQKRWREGYQITVHSFSMTTVPNCQLEQQQSQRNEQQSNNAQQRRTHIIITTCVVSFVGYQIRRNYAHANAYWNCDFSIKCITRNHYFAAINEL